MKCPDCGYNSFEYLDACKKCGASLDVRPIYKTVYKPIRESESSKDILPDQPTEREEKFADITSSYETHPAEMTQPEETYEDIPETTDEPFSVADDEEEFEDEDSLESIQPWEAPQDNVEYYALAGISSRAAAFGIDLVILSGAMTLVLGSGLYFVSANLNISASGITDLILSIYMLLLFLGSTYFIFLQGMGGKTIGKMIFGIRIIKEDGEPIGLWVAFLRWVGYFISSTFAFIGFLWAFVDSEQQTWHDKIAKTYVVKDRMVVKS